MIRSTNWNKIEISEMNFFAQNMRCWVRYKEHQVSNILFHNIHSLQLFIQPLKPISFKFKFTETSPVPDTKTWNIFFCTSDEKSLPDTDLNYNERN